MLISGSDCIWKRMARTYKKLNMRSHYVSNITSWYNSYVVTRRKFPKIRKLSTRAPCMLELQPRLNANIRLCRIRVGGSMFKEINHCLLYQMDFIDIK